MIRKRASEQVPQGVHGEQGHTLSSAAVALVAAVVAGVVAWTFIDSPFGSLFIGVLLGWLVFIWLNHYAGRTTIADITERRRPSD
jgi:hypothetical protein